MEKKIVKKAKCIRNEFEGIKYPLEIGKEYDITAVISSEFLGKDGYETINENGLKVVFREDFFDKGVEVDSNHYDKGGLSTISIMESKFGVEAAKTFALLNAFKYIIRCEHKGNKGEDLFKAENYLHYIRTGEFIKDGK